MLKSLRRIFIDLDERVVIAPGHEAPIPSDAEVVLAVPQSWVLVKPLRLPAADARELAAMADLQAASLLPVPPAELLSGFEPLGAADGHSEILLSVIRRDKLRPVLDALADRGVPVHRAVPGALAGFLRFLKENPSPDTVLLLDLGEETAIGIAEGGALRALRGIGGSVDARRLAAEIASTAAGKNIVRGVFFGPANLKPAVDLPLSPAAEGQTAAAHGAAYLPAMNTDLLPAEDRRRARQSREAGDRRVFAVLCGALLLCGLGAWAVGRRRADARAAVLAAIQTEGQETHARLEALKRNGRGAGSAIEALRAVERGVPAGVTLLSLVSEGNGRMTLNGTAGNIAKAVETVESLKKQTYFAQVEMTSSQTRLAGDREVTEFAILCRAGGNDAR